MLYVLRCSYAECMYIYNCYIFFLEWSLHHYVVSFFVSCYNLCLKLYFFWYKYCYLSLLLIPFAWNTSLHQLTFSLCVSLYLKWVSYSIYFGEVAFYRRRLVCPSSILPSGHQNCKFYGCPLYWLCGFFCCGWLSTVGSLVGVAVPQSGWSSSPVLCGGYWPLVGRAGSLCSWLLDCSRSWSLCCLTGGQSQVLGWVVAGSAFLDLVSACWWMGSVPDTASCRFLGIPKLVLAHWWIGLNSRMAGWGVQSISEMVLACWWVGVVRAQGIPGLLPAPWCVGPGPGPCGRQGHVQGSGGLKQS